MENKLKLFILACTITGSLAFLCKDCTDNLFGGQNNCSVPATTNCTAEMITQCTPGSPGYDNCTRDTVIACLTASFNYTDDSGAQQVGQLKGCSFPSSADAAVCSQNSCSMTQAMFNQTNNTLNSCSATCCFSSNCNLPVTASPSAINTVASSPPPTTLMTTESHNGASSPVVQVSCPYFVVLLLLVISVLRKWSSIQ